MTRASNDPPALNSDQLAIVRGLVGDLIARQDLPALESAYGDFRAGMDSLKEDFDRRTGSGSRQRTVGEVTR